MSVIKIERSEPDFDRLNDDVAALIKGMLMRGDKQSDIAACFLINGGRISEINTGKTFSDIGPAPLNQLPPPGPYPSPYELWVQRSEMWKVRVALEELEESFRRAITIVHKIEKRS